MLPEWTDAHLTPLGLQQADRVRNFWEHALKDHRVPAPQVYITSPLTRCLQTADASFRGLQLPPESPYAPVVKEVRAPDF